MVHLAQPKMMCLHILSWISIAEICVRVHTIMHACDYWAGQWADGCDCDACRLGFVAAWFAMFSGLSGLIAYRLSQIKKLLDPVSSGVLTLH